MTEPTTSGEKGLAALTFDDPMWGTLRIDRAALLDALGKATTAVGEAHALALWRSESAGRINSAWADALFGINSTLDALIDLLDVVDSDGLVSHTEDPRVSAPPEGMSPTCAFCGEPIYGGKDCWHTKDGRERCPVRGDLPHPFHKPRSELAG